MMVCAKCRIEMRCTKTGCLTVWGESHAYSGDEYTCSECGAIVRKLANVAREIEGAMSLHKCKPIQMRSE